MAVKLLAADASTLNSTFNVNAYVPDGKLLESFNGPNNWIGHVTSNSKGVRLIFWEDPTGLVVVGKLLDSNGRDLNKLAEEHYDTNSIGLQVISKIQVSTEQLEAGADEATAARAGVYSELQALPEKNYTSTGDGDIEMFVFYDYECPYCKHLKEYLETDGHNVKSNWLPVAILNKNSPVFGAAVLDGQIPLAKMGQKGGDYPAPSLEAFEAVTHNTRLLKALQSRASTPTIVMKMANGEVKTLQGFSEQAPQTIQALIRDSQS